VNGLQLFMTPELYPCTSLLPARRPRRGQITADRAVAEAKLADAETIEDAVQRSNPRGKACYLGDPPSSMGAASQSAKPDPAAE